MSRTAVVLGLVVAAFALPALAAAPAAAPAPATPAAAGKAPAEGTPEYAIRESLQMIRDGKLDEWIAKYCDPRMCHDADSNDQQKRFGLARAQPDAAKCLHGDDDQITVTRTKGDVTKDDTNVQIWIQCEEGRLPAPATMFHHDGKWLFSSYSW